MRDLYSQVINRQDGNQADHSLRDPTGNERQIGICHRWKVDKAVEAARDPFQRTIVSQGIQRARVDAGGKRLTGADRPAVVGDDLGYLVRG